VEILIKLLITTRALLCWHHFNRRPVASCGEHVISVEYLTVVWWNIDKVAEYIALLRNQCGW